MMVRLLLLLNLAAVLTIVGKYLIELRDDPRVVAGWVMVPASLTMAASTLLTTVFHRRRLRHAWLFAGVVGASACLWWLSALDNFTAKEHVALVLACWGACIGLFPPVFLTDEVEGVSPKDMMYAGSLAVVGLIVPLVTIPTMTGTVIKAWSDRALDVYRANLSENRPARGGGRAPGSPTTIASGGSPGPSSSAKRRPCWARSPRPRASPWAFARASAS